MRAALAEFHSELLNGSNLPILVKVAGKQIRLADFPMGVSFFISMDYAPVHTNLLCRS